MISPSVDEGHGHIIDEDGHLFILRRGKIFTYFEVTFSFDGLLEHEGGGGGREIDSLEEHFVFIEFLTVH